MNNYNAIVPLKMLHKLKLEPIFEGSFTVRALSPTPLIIRCSRLFHITKYNDVGQCSQLRMLYKKIVNFVKFLI